MIAFNFIKLGYGEGTYVQRGTEERIETSGPRTFSQES